MRTFVAWMAAATAALWIGVAPLWGQEMRESQTQARQAREALIRKAGEEKATAEKAAVEQRGRIAQDRVALEKALAALETPNRALKAEVQRLTEQSGALEAKESDLTRRLTETDAMIQELVGVIRANAKDMDAMAAQNPQTALSGDHPDYLAAVADASRFPGMAEVSGMTAALLRQIRAAGEVSLQKGRVIDRTGRETEAEILSLGPFTAAYRIGAEVGFLNYAEGRGLSALSRLPGRAVRKELARYMQGRSDAVPMDIARGAALHQMTHAVSFWRQVPKGGPIGWMIVVIFFVALAMVGERALFLRRRDIDGDALIAAIEKHAAERRWEACAQLCAAERRKPLARVMRAGLDYFHATREEMESALQEAILREIPPLERFLSVLTMLAAIAPLLGLLGTVTGMIDTFHVITLQGSADPRMMSSGISEALVTTMLGLIAAIPIMLLHTLLSRNVDGRIAQMEEKSVALVNIAHKNRKGGLG